MSGIASVAGSPASPWRAVKGPTTMSVEPVMPPAVALMLTRPAAPLKRTSAVPLPFARSRLSTVRLPAEALKPTVPPKPLKGLLPLLPTAVTVTPKN